MHLHFAGNWEKKKQNREGKLLQGFEKDITNTVSPLRRL
jgi:hypothetical protein